MDYNKQSPADRLRRLYGLPVRTAPSGSHRNLSELFRRADDGMEPQGTIRILQLYRQHKCAGGSL